MAKRVTAKQLRQAREASGLTQKEAAAVCEVDERTYQRWESGETTRIRAVYLDLIARGAREAPGEG